MEKQKNVRRNWTREETILAFELYCRTPFGRIHTGNPDIQELAAMIGRKPGAVALKMQNLAHYDPVLRERNVTAMSHGSKQDKIIYEEFCQDLTRLLYEAHKIKMTLYNQDIHKIIKMDDAEELLQIPAGEYKERLLKTRLGQYFFRSTVLGAYSNRCCVTGLNNQELLIASHIKPWNVSDEKTERTNPRNGLCLNSLHDKAFDRGLITISTDYEIIVSEELAKCEMDEKTKGWFMSYNKNKIILPDKFRPGKEFIEYHNDMVFKH